MKIFYALLIVLLLAVAAGYSVYRWAPRPVDTTDPSVFSADGAALDYCDLPLLRGPLVTADDIPKAFTPGCGWETFPAPILATCTEPLIPGAPDLRGLWLGYEGALVGHVERVEQCGDRVVITSGRIIHDMRANGSLSDGANDVGASCRRIFASAQYEDGVLVLHPFGTSFVTTVTRELDGDDMLWGYGTAGVTRLKRICRIP